MTLFELLQKAIEENERNFQNLKILDKLEKKLKDTKRKKIAALNEKLAKNEIGPSTYLSRVKEIKADALLATKQLEQLYAPQSKFNEIRARLKDCGVFISNKMMCSLLKNQTGTNWTYDIVEESPKMARLYFRNDKGEEYRPQAGILENGGNLEDVVKALENINWFQEYLSAKNVPDSDIMELTFVTGQKRLLFPPFIKTTLDNFFKHIKIDLHHPESLSLDDHRFDLHEKYEPHNLYYRYQRDKKAGKFDHPDGKNGK